MDKSIKNFSLVGSAFPASIEKYSYIIKEGKLFYDETVNLEKGYKQIKIELEINNDICNKIENLTKDWKDHYTYENLQHSSNILDGFSWEMNIEYDDTTNKHIEGYEEYPDNYMN